MEFHELCRFCAINLADLQIQLFSTKGPNLQEIVDKFFPIKISEADNLPKCICKACFAQAMVVQKFFQSIINAEKVLKHKHDELEEQKATRIKIISEKLVRLPISIKKVPVKQPVVLSPVSVIDTNKNGSIANNSTNISEVLNKLKGVTVKKTKISFVVKEPLEEQKTPDPTPLTPRRTTRNKPVIYKDEEPKLPSKNDSDEEYKPPTSTTPRSTPKKKRISNNGSNAKSPTSKAIIKMVLNTGPAYVCVTCKGRFESFDQLKDHMTQTQRCKDANVTCRICGKVCGNRKSLYAHSLSHKERITFTCEICSKSFVNRPNLENHKVSVHKLNIEENDGSVFRCRLCEKQFTTRADLFSHNEEHKKENVERLCETCGKAFTSMEALKSHYRTHSTPRTHPCTEKGCDKSFRSRVQLTNHLHIHTGVKSFACKKCDKKYAKKSSLALHEKTHNNMEMPHKCPICDVSYVNEIKLKAHIKTLHPEKPNEKSPDRTIEDTVVIQPTSGQPSSYTLSFQNF